MRRFLSFSAAGLFALGSAACAPPAPGPLSTAGPSPAPGPFSTAAPSTLRVFAAASLTEAFGEIARAFEAASPGSKVEFNFAGSQQLAAQIVEGAPADVFASANANQMDAVIQAGAVVSGTQRSFARNRLVVVFPKDNPAGVRQLPDLAQPGLKLVLAAKSVPVGSYSLAFLGQTSRDPRFTASFSPTVLANVVSFEDDVKAVLAKISLGEADAGIVYASDLTPRAAENVGRLEISDELNVIATYPIAPLAHSERPAAARAFVDYVTSAAAQAVLAKHGFMPRLPD